MDDLCYFTDRLSAEIRIMIYGYVFGENPYVKWPATRSLRDVEDILNAAQRIKTSGSEDTVDAELERNNVTNITTLLSLVGQGVVHGAEQTVNSAVDGAAEQEVGEPADDAQGSGGKDETMRGSSDRFLNTAILIVNNSISVEALETLYNTKTFSLTVTELINLFPTNFVNLVRNIEIADCREPNFAELGSSVLAVLRQLPRLKTVTVLSDCLASIRDGKDFVSVRGFAAATDLGEVTCVDVGRYVLQGQLEHVMFANSKLLRMWPNVANMPADYDAHSEAEEVLKRWSMSGNMANLMAWASQTSLRLWVGLYEQAIDSVGEEWPDFQSEEFHRRLQIGSFVRTMQSRMPDVPLAPQGEHGLHVSLHKLRPSHDPATLEWATELLCMNIASHRLYFDDVQSYESVETSWPEVDGVEPTGFLQARAQNAARAVWEANTMIRHPVDMHSAIDVDIAKQILTENHVISMLFGHEWVQTANIQQVRPLIYLLMATQMFNFGPEKGEDDGDGRDEEAEALNDWCGKLLKTYLLAAYDVTDPVPDDNAEDWTLQDMREAMRMTLACITIGIEEGGDQRLSEGLEDDGEDVSLANETDVFVPLVRHFGDLLLNVWRLQKQAMRWRATHKTGSESDENVEKGEKGGSVFAEALLGMLEEARSRWDGRRSQQP